MEAQSRNMYTTTFFARLSNPTNIAGVNLVISCNKGFFFHYSNTCAGVLTLYKRYEDLVATRMSTPCANYYYCRHRDRDPNDANIGWAVGAYQQNLLQSEAYQECVVGWAHASTPYRKKTVGYLVDVLGIKAHFKDLGKSLLENKQESMMINH